MAKTASMKLVELMVMREDIYSVISFLGKKKNFQFQNRFSSVEGKNSKIQDTALSDSKTSGSVKSREKEVFDNLQKQRLVLAIEDLNDYQNPDCIALPSEEDYDEAKNFCDSVDALKSKIDELELAEKKSRAAYNEALAFSNLKVPFSELDKLSFLTLRIGQIEASCFDQLRFAVGDRAAIVKLNSDENESSVFHILAASSKKGRFALDAVLKDFGFSEIKISSDFKGVPDDVLLGLKSNLKESEEKLLLAKKECQNFALTHKEKLYRLLQIFSVGVQVSDIVNKLESTQMVTRITGWIPEAECKSTMKELDELSSGRIAVRIYSPEEVPSVIAGVEKVPVKLHHGTFVASFERMIFSYGSPLYGNIDPTPFVAFFFTVLFGIMFGDAGQGFVFLLAGILMALKVIKVGNWNKFAPVFMGIGASSMIMGLLTGEVFAKEVHFASGPILNLSPSGENYISAIFAIFALTIAFGFVVNSIGLILNFINNLNKKHYGSAFFGKLGLAGAFLFWYVIAFAIKIAFFHKAPAFYDWIIIFVFLFFAAFGEPFVRLFNGERPAIENGFASVLIGGLVEIIEVVSTYISSSISFVRVGAFALAHAALGFIISLMTEKAGPAGGIFVLIIGNAIVIVLEGMIVAIQVLRLQYYEFFSKFFNETGKEFLPFSFNYKKNQ